MEETTSGLKLSPRIHLRRYKSSDIDLICMLNNDEGVMEYIDSEPPSREEAEEEIQRIIQEYDISPRSGKWIAETPTPEGMEFIGWLRLGALDELSRQCFGSTNAESNEEVVRLELGYRIRRRFWGQGLATEGGRALVQYAFCSLNIAQVVAGTMFVNSRSRRVMEKCGLKHFKTLHLDFRDPLPGTELGEVFYAITREEWLDSAGSCKETISSV
ncbi:acetyltransferase [Nannizzia gypsea CBS 118893]|uniref:Acetyltransferase n=1 Tax=Arthroderma gypseum (strain ATCC MYA-4604 / CBS 118893) TaxID=535722 RepID=E4V5G8_ARTGP|nr:acetyltransferase [Nannizzia gypsea CBS 118893]EFR05343.1 acetyltransferase [Nannizzia gypsea CBS 118893]